MKPTEVGKYSIGLRPIRLVVIDSISGSVEPTPKDGGSTIVNVGINQPWDEAVGVLLHELYEIALIDLNTRYKPKPSYSKESSDYIFLMTHNQLGEAHERLGEIISRCFSDFRMAYDKFNKRKKK